MKYLHHLLTLLLVPTSILAQSNTEVFLMDFKFSEGVATISNLKNVSNNPDYDSQPSFYDARTLIFSGTRKKATDIAAYNIPSGQSWWMNLPTDGGEYSPQRIPSSGDVAAVRLDPDGLQRLYRYPLPEKPSEELIQGLQVAYYAFYDADKMLASVLSTGQLDLVVHDFKNRKTDTILQGSGRSIHKVPGTSVMSYTATNEEGNMDIYQLDMKTMESFFVAQLPIGIQDHIWLDETTLLIGSGNKLYVNDLFSNGEWKEVADLSAYHLDEITRLTYHPEAGKLALVAESSAASPEEVVQQQLDAYNNRDIEGFLATYDPNIELYNFPDLKIGNGIDFLRKQYTALFEGAPDLNAELKNRMVIGNKIIDEEYLTMNGQNFSAVAIYEVNNGLITKVTFLR